MTGVVRLRSCLRPDVLKFHKVLPLGVSGGACAGHGSGACPAPYPYRVIPYVTRLVIPVHNQTGHTRSVPRLVIPRLVIPRLVIPD